VYADTHGSVVRIDTGGALGAGFLFHQPRYVATAYHVVSLGRPIEVTLADGSTTPAEVVATDPDNDLAILELERPPADLRPLAAGQAERIPLGAPVIVIGHPYALDPSGPQEGLLNWSVSQGIISGRGTHLLQTDAAVNPGNSGGPLIDCRGRALGVVSAKLFAEGIGFVVPVTRLEDLVEEIGRVSPELDAWQFGLGAGLAIHANPDEGLVGFGVGLSAIAYDSWVATLRVGQLWSTGGELEPGVLDRSMQRFALELDVQHRWLVMTRPFPWYLGLGVGGVAARTTDTWRTADVRLTPPGCAGTLCNVELYIEQSDASAWHGWPAAMVTTNFFGNLEASYGFLPDVTDVESSVHRILLGFVL
jgi:S1-C subfamily serine protease